MNWEAAGAIGEIVGAFAVVLTLFYLARQLRQSNLNTEASVESQMGSWWSHANREMILSSDMIEVIEKGLNDTQALSDPDRRRFSWWLASLFYMFDNLHKQYQKGVLPKNSWVMNEMSISGLMKSRSVSLWWESGFFQATPDFKQRVEEIRKEGSDIPWQWVDIARVFDDA